MVEILNPCWGKTGVTRAPHHHNNEGGRAARSQIRGWGDVTISAVQSSGLGDDPFTHTHTTHRKKTGFDPAFAAEGGRRNISLMYKGKYRYVEASRRGTGQSVLSVSSVYGAVNNRADSLGISLV